MSEVCLAVSFVSSNSMKSCHLIWPSFVHILIVESVNRYYSPALVYDETNLNAFYE